MSESITLEDVDRPLDLMSLQVPSSVEDSKLRLMEEFRQVAPSIYRLLQDSSSVEAARENLYTYLNGQEKDPPGARYRTGVHQSIENPHRASERSAGRL
jgi:hypothetical protein